MDTANGSQIANEAIWISYSANALRKCMQPGILPLALGKNKADWAL